MSSYLSSKPARRREKQDARLSESVWTDTFVKMEAEAPETLTLITPNEIVHHSWAADVLYKG